jgi:hypothetical protein
LGVTAALKIGAAHGTWSPIGEALLEIASPQPESWLCAARAARHAPGGGPNRALNVLVLKSIQTAWSASKLASIGKHVSLPSWPGNWHRKLFQNDKCAYTATADIANQNWCGIIITLK